MKSTVLIGSERLVDTTTGLATMDKSRATWATLARRAVPVKAFALVGKYGNFKGSFKTACYASYTTATLLSSGCATVISENTVPTLTYGKAPDLLRWKALVGPSTFGHWAKTNQFVDPCTGQLLDGGVVKLTTRARGGDSHGYLPSPELTGAFMDLIAGRGDIQLGDYFPGVDIVLKAESKPTA